MFQQVLLALGFGGGIVVGAFVGLGLVAVILYLIFWPNRERERIDRMAIGQDVLDEALERAKAQVEVPPEVEQSFITHYWMRLSKLFKL